LHVEHLQGANLVNTNDDKKPAKPDRDAPVAKPVRKDRRIKKVMRLLVYCSCICLVGAGLAARAASGGMKKAGLPLGPELEKRDGVGSKQPVRLNGQPIYIASTVEDIGMHEALENMEQTCRQNSAGLAKELDDLTPAAKKLLPIDPSGKEAAG